MSSRAVVCLSGGMDSCVTLAEALRSAEVYALHLQYGQRTAPRELIAFEAICAHYGVEHKLVAPQPALAQIGGSALTDAAIDVPSQAADTGVPITYVPFRNAQILSLACAWAEILGAPRVYLGAVEEDSSGYPDCREEFFQAFERAVDLGTRPETKLEIVTPLLHQTKSEIVARGMELQAPLHLTWSCYSQQDLACGVCESCRLRLKGFEGAGIEDPLPYASNT